MKFSGDVEAVLSCCSITGSINSQVFNFMWSAWFILCVECTFVLCTVGAFLLSTSKMNIG